MSRSSQPSEPAPTERIEAEIRALAANYSLLLKKKIDERLIEIDADDTSHFVLYNALGISTQEGKLIDAYQNKGRFLYRYAGAFLEAAARLCFLERHPGSKPARVTNTLGSRPKTFEIDCLVGTDAIEIKWRDATTDGDHVAKEHSRIRVISAAGFTPIRVMFFYPNRAQAIRIQQALESLYDAIGGQYHHGDNAWAYIADRTGVDLRGILKILADEYEG